MGFFVAAALNPIVFDALILISTILIFLGWIYAYTDAKGQKFWNAEKVTSYTSKNCMRFLLTDCMWTSST